MRTFARKPSPIRPAAARGNALPSIEARSSFEPRFGHHFARVLVHADAGTLRRKDENPSGKAEPAKEEKAAETMTNCRKNYTVESWEGETCCTNRGFADARFKNKEGACCNTFPKFVDDEAVRQGFDGAASCRSREFLNHRARVTPGRKSPTSVDVLCVDTRRKKSAHFIELGYNAARKAYGSIHVLDEKATVCMGDNAEGETCYFKTDCNETKNPKESQCIPPDCSKSEKRDEPKK